MANEISYIKNDWVINDIIHSTDMNSVANAVNALIDKSNSAATINDSAQSSASTYSSSKIESAITASVSGKQDTLIAGSGITISGNTISSNGGRVNDVQIDAMTIIDENGNANINLGPNLSFNRSTKTLNVIEPERVVEHVELQLSVDYGSVDFSGRTIIVTYEGSSHSIELDENGEGSFDVTLGSFYTIKYPSFLYYSSIPDSSYVAAKLSRILIKTYSYLGNAIRSVKLQQSNPVTWTTSGDSMVIDSILNQYGTYVIDEENKKYAKLNSGNHTYFEDGTVWDGSYGNSFRRIPTVYYYVTSDDNNQPILKISPNDIGGHSWEEAWIGTYKGSIVGNKLRSIPGATTTQSTTMSNFWNAAQQNSIDYGLVNYFQHCMLLGLHYAKFGTSQSETTMGPGLQNAGSGYYTHITGYSKELGDGTGSMPYAGSATLTMNKLFGIEDLAGSTWEFRPNIRFSGSGAIATVYEGNIVSNTASGRTFQKLSSASQAYITEMVLGEYCDFIPKTVGGTSSTYYCDGTWASSSGELLLVGGISGHGTLCGLSAAYSSSAFSDSYANVGARLAFYGDISSYTLVSGQELNSLHSN